MEREEKDPFDIQNIRDNSPILSHRYRNKPLIYLNNATTTQKPHHVINKVNEFYMDYNANVHRTIYQIGVMEKLNVATTVRASFYVYNSKNEIDLLCESIQKAIDFMR